MTGLNTLSTATKGAVSYDPLKSRYAKARASYHVDNRVTRNQVAGHQFRNDIDGKLSGAVGETKLVPRIEATYRL